LDYKYEGLIIGMTGMKCIHDETDFLNSIIYFTIPKEMLGEKIRKASYAFKDICELTLKYKVK
jgi:hypothetical protein